MTKGGITITVGRRMTSPRARVNSRLVTGSGATRLTGPSSSSWSTRKRNPRTTSASEIHGTYWRPEPTLPPTPSLKGSSTFSINGPFLAMTTPVRGWTTRIPASRAGSAEDSQTAHVWAMKSSPGDDDSVSTSSPRSP